MNYNIASPHLRPCSNSPLKCHISRPDPNNRGFTLIEILLAVALLSIILGAVYSTFFLAHKAVTGTDESLLRLQEGRAILDTMRREIESLEYNSQKKYTVFMVQDRDSYGKQTSRIVFTSFSPLVPGLSSISYYIKERDKRLILYKEMVSAVRPAEGTPEPIEVSENIESFTVEAKGADDKWIKTWNAAETGRPPVEIRVRLGISVKDRVINLSEVVSPMIGM